MIHHLMKNHHRSLGDVISNLRRLGRAWPRFLITDRYDFQVGKKVVHSKRREETSKRGKTRMEIVTRAGTSLLAINRRMRLEPSSCVSIWTARCFAGHLNRASKCSQFLPRYVRKKALANLTKWCLIYLEDAKLMFYDFEIAIIVDSIWSAGFHCGLRGY